MAFGERLGRAMASDGIKNETTPMQKIGLLFAVIAMLFFPVAARGQAISPDALVRAYTDQIAGRDDAGIILRDGTRQNLSDGKTNKSFDEKLKNASLMDRLSLPYPKGVLTKPPGPQDDPGRFRNTAFFDKMYGIATRRNQKHLTDIRWFTGKVRVTTVNGVAERLRAVAMEIDRLPQDIKRYAYPSAGAFNCRVVKDTGKRSMHAYGAAIDLNTAFSDYWLWRKGGYRNRIPYEIVEIFDAMGSSGAANGGILTRCISNTGQNFSTRRQAPMRPNDTAIEKDDADHHVTGITGSFLMKTQKIFAALGLIGAIGAGSIGAGAPTPASAQEPAYMSCEELWYARNEIYGRNGYCFNTDRARSMFGAGCSHLTGG